MKTRERSQIIEGLRICSTNETCVGCPYRGELRSNCFRAMINDAYLLLTDDEAARNQFLYDLYVWSAQNPVTKEQLTILQGLLSSCGAWFTHDVEDALRAAVRFMGGQA